jgi:hypothetical protein
MDDEDWQVEEPGHTRSVVLSADVIGIRSVGSARGTSGESMTNTFLSPG